MSHPSEQPAIEIERQVLRCLCQGKEESNLGGEVKAALHHYRWRERLHAVIFQILCNLPSDSGGLARAQLPARMTLYGFPDVEWERYFVPLELTEGEMRGLVARLLGSSEEAGSPSTAG